MTTGSQRPTVAAVNGCGAIVPHTIRLDLRVRDKAALLLRLAEDASGATGLDPVNILGVLRKREALGSTGVGNGIALPHAAIATLESPFGLLARLDRGIDYGAVDEKPVDLVFLLLTPLHDSKADLSNLSAVARTLRSGDLLKALRKAATAAEMQAAWTSAR